MDREPVIAALTEALRRSAVELSCAYLFGSLARGEERPGSDADVAALFPSPPPATLLGPAATLRGELEAAAGRPVDLIVLNRAAPDLVHRILRDGVLLNERDPSARVRFEVAARNAYFDLLPHLREYRRGRAA